MFFTPHFWPFKNHWTGQKLCFLIRRLLKKSLFLSDLPQGVLFCQNKSQLSNLQNGHREMFLFNPHFWPFKHHWTCQKSCFLIRRVSKSLFSIWHLPRGSCFAKIRVSCQTFKMVIQRCFFLPSIFDHFKSHWTGQKSCFLIRRVLKKPFFYLTSPQGILFGQNKSKLWNLQNGHREIFLFNPPFLTI